MIILIMSVNNRDGYDDDDDGEYDGDVYDFIGYECK